jgi:uncharacterized protein (TIGR02001 family)
MNKLLLSTVAALLMSAGLASAADLPMKAPPAAPVTPVWDIAFGGALMTDYNFRGISQSDRRPSATAYIEPRYNLTPNVQLYVGVQGWATKLPTDPTGEFDLYGGIRPTFGALALDFGFIYYYYPGERQQFTNAAFTTVLDVLPPGGSILTLANTDFWEVYAKGTYTFNDSFSVGAQFYYSDSWLNTGASGAFLNGTVKYVLPANWFPTGVGAFVSADLAHYWLGTATSFQPFLPPFALPDYNTWDVGVGFTYKVFTLDVRYYDTDLSKAECFLLTGDPRGVPSGQSKWCGSSVIAKLSFDMTLNANVK